MDDQVSPDGNSCISSSLGEETSWLLLKPCSIRHGQKRDTGIVRQVLQTIIAWPISLLKCKKINPDKILEGEYPMLLFPRVFDFSKVWENSCFYLGRGGEKNSFPPWEIDIVLFVHSGLYFCIVLVSN